MATPIKAAKIHVYDPDFLYGLCGVCCAEGLPTRIHH
jgi:hypothetical protein